MLSRLLYSVLNFPLHIVYAGIFLLMFFLGEEVLLVIGALSRLHLLNFWTAYLAAFLGTVGGDIFWYKIGERYGEQFVSKYGDWFFMTSKRFKKLELIINKKNGLFIFATKFMYGINHISEVAAGAVRFGFKKYLKRQIIVSAIWSFGFVSLGYFFADNLKRLKHDVALFIFVLLGVFVLLILLDRAIEKIVEKKVLRIENGNGDKN